MTRKRWPADVGSLDEREVLLDLVQGPPSTYQAQQVLHCETVSADARLSAHLAGLDSDAVKVLHTANVPQS
jgi:hypothetical protein